MGNNYNLERFLILSGSICAGKSTISNELSSKFSFRRISSGRFLQNEASNRGYGHGRHDLQELGDTLDNETEYKWIVDPLSLDSISSEPNRSRWLLDAARKKQQIILLRSTFGECVRHVHLSAPEEVLHKRFAERLDYQTKVYEQAVQHPNEVSARSLAAIADKSFDTTQLMPAEIANSIVTLWE